MICKPDFYQIPSCSHSSRLKLLLFPCFRVRVCSEQVIVGLMLALTESSCTGTAMSGTHTLTSRLLFDLLQLHMLLPLEESETLFQTARESS